jgi:uncharacterized protein
MKIAIIGATGNVGRRIVSEALNRSHSVTAIARTVNLDVLPSRDKLSSVIGDANEPDQLAELIAGHDVIVSSIMFLKSDISKLVTAVRTSGVKRYLIVGGAGSLLSPTGHALVDETDFTPKFAIPEATKGKEYLTYMCEVKDLDWTVLSPSKLFTAGERTGNFRLGGNHVLIGTDGKSWISYEDYAVAMLDEIENPKHIRQRFCVGY